MTLPHVTDILAGVGIIDTRWFTPESRDRGTAIHAAIQYMLDGDLDWSSLSPEIACRVSVFQRFMLETRMRPLAWELRVEAPDLGYCGTLDLQCVLSGNLAVVDYKSGQPARWHGVQLAAYAYSLDGPHQRWGLYLGEESYKLVPYRSRDDLRVFTAALTIHNWRTK